MTRELSDEVKAKLFERLLIQRLGSGQEVAAAVAFLASPDAAYITGHTLHVNGGMFLS